MFAFYLPASLIVRTEPQSEIGQQREKNMFVLPLPSSNRPNAAPKPAASPKPPSRATTPTKGGN